MNEPLVFKPVSADDADALVAIRIAAMRPSLERIGRFDAQRAAERLLSGFEPRHTWAIELTGERVGFFTLVPIDGTLQLDHLYVLPEHQRGGIGKAVLTRVFEQADALGKELRVTALVGSDANRFYLAHGFKLVSHGEFDNHYLRRPRSSSAPNSPHPGR